MTEDNPTGPSAEPERDGDAAPPEQSRDSRRNRLITLGVILGVIAAAVIIYVAVTNGGTGKAPGATPPSASVMELISPEPNENPSQSADANQNPEYVPLGEMTTVGDWTVSVHDPVLNATDELVKAGADKPPEGMQYSYTYVTVTNNGSAERSVYESLTMGYVDASGQTHETSRALGPDDVYELDPVAPGAQVSGTYVFEVPAADPGNGTWAIAEVAENPAEAAIAYFTTE